MAEDKFQNTSSVITNSFMKGMLKDPNASFEPKENWSHARNTVNNSVDGDVAVIGNEPANIQCAVIPYTIIGAIHRYADQWVIFCTDDVNSEIGLFDDSQCSYTTLINAPCLSFNRKYLITGAAKENSDCTWQIYWDDSNNPSRTLNINDIPYLRVITSPPGADCITYEDTTILDCEKIRLAPLVTTPCVELNKAENGGQLRNGAYQAFIAYVVNDQKVTDYIGVSNVQTLFDHAGTSGSLNISISNLDPDFDYFELVILSNNQQNTVAKRIGIYSTQQFSITIDYIDQSLITIPLEIIPLRNPAYEKSEAMYVVNDWLIRSGPTEQFDFNYQAIANNIKTVWVVAEYPASYYYKGGNKTGFMRDEQYSFFIRWIYNTGERSSSYHIPGRAPDINGTNQYGDIVDETAIGGGVNTINPGQEYNFQIYNTAALTSIVSTPTSDGGLIIAKGEMAYWQSTEKYPADRPDIWGNLCGKYIRHHKMPSEETTSALKISSTNAGRIRILGVEFSNIGLPVYNDGTVIPNIVGYEILRGSREGQKSILAKGIFRNMRKYTIPEGADLAGSTQGLYPNYPYNDLREDVYFHDGIVSKRTDGSDRYLDSITKYKPLTGVADDVFTFHSPELMFKRPFLNAYETRIYGELRGESSGYFIKSENHPQNKLLRNATVIIAGIFGVGYALEKIRGRKKKVYDPRKPLDLGLSTLPVGIVAPAPGLNTGQSFLSTTVGYQATQLALDSAFDLIVNSTVVAATDIVTGGATTEIGYAFASAFRDGLASVFPGGIGGGHHYEVDGTEFKEVPTALMFVTGYFNFLQQFAIGTNEIIELMYNLVKASDFAYKYNSHGFYNEYIPTVKGDIYRTINGDANYVGSSFQQFASTYKINNLFRPATVAVKTNFILPRPLGLDNSRFVIGGLNNNNLYFNPQTPQKTEISVLYGALKFNFENQYGQLDGIKQVQMRGCIYPVTTDIAQATFGTGAIFSGDIYIGRYTEKTIMPIFSNFLNGQPDEYPYDYLKRINIPYPRYWMDTRKYDVTRMADALSAFSDSKLKDALPNDLFYLDRHPQSVRTKTNRFTFDNVVGKDDPYPLFTMEDAYMYTHNNGIQDFFVESEINLAQRDWEDENRYRHYDTYEYANVDDLFHADIIKDGNFYKYDYSLSVSRFLTNLTSFGNIQPRYYDPLTSEFCYVHYPKRLIYSLQAQHEAKKDFWRVFLPNNYKDFKNKVNIIKPINKSGAIIFFPYQSPQMFQGLDQLQTDLGTKLTIGDGGLFSQPFQNIANSDLPNEYGSCESSRSVMNTPFGVFFLSQAQGKVFQYSGQLDNIANAGMKWWFNKYLPSVLLRQFPDLENSVLLDNPVVGVGCQTIFDANNDIVYFMKKDYAVKDEFLSGMTFNTVTQSFIYTTEIGVKLPITLGDPMYFNNCSWTVSYDPKSQVWISFHDWFPELCLSSINHFLTTQSKVTTTPYCPPGYNYNLTTGQCEKAEQRVDRAAVVVDDVAVMPSGECILDIVFALDCSTSTGNPLTPGSIANAEISFVNQFLLDAGLSAEMAAGNIQIGFVAWADSPVPLSMNPLGFSMSNTVPSATVKTWYESNWFGGGTDIDAALAYAELVLNQKGTSQLGDRSANPNLRQLIVLVTDTSQAASPAAGCSYQSISLGGFATGPANQFVYAVYAGATSTVPPFPTVLNDISCYKSAYEFGINAAAPATITTVVNGILTTTCDASCNCPVGYTPVYRNYQTLYFTESTGACTPNNVICRKIECSCPEPPFEGAVTTSTGVCDDIYGVGSPEYINQNPKICSYYALLSTPAGFKNGGLWRHNYRCDLYANYYGVDYPWEVEFVSTTGQTVNTLRSVEYQLESYVYKGDLINACGDDRWHDLDYNFNEAILYNTEQISGLLRLEISPKNDPYGILQYPIIGGTDIRILYSKEEQKYRFNQFWDITNDRGEFNNVQQRLFITELNGYVRNLNPINLDYNKEPIQHKKFRHYFNKLILRRTQSGNRKMLFKLANTKFNLSFR
jgi:hypothetical protein